LRFGPDLQVDRGLDREPPQGPDVLEPDHGAARTGLECGRGHQLEDHRHRDDRGALVKRSAVGRTVEGVVDERGLGGHGELAPHHRHRGGIR
jgi:hypothetical protein